MNISDEHAADEAIEAVTTDGEHPEPSNFIYLMNARVLGTPKPTGPIQQHFKLRLSDVTAWAFGEPS